MDKEQKSLAQEGGSGQSPIDAHPAGQSEDTKLTILSANLRTLQPVYFSAMLEEVRLFDVVDRLVAMFGHGMLPLRPGRAGAMLYRHWKGHHSRLTTEQRHNVYARAFGLLCGDATVIRNGEFNDLWMRFVSIVGMYSAELQSLPPGERSVRPEEVLEAGRDLASNLSTHGQGLAWFAAQDFKHEIQQSIELLSDAELQSAFDAKDEWRLIHNVAARELGARPNVARGHTRAKSGAIIIRWLANRRARLLRPRSANILKHEDICEGRTAASLNKKATVYPTDSDLVTACEQWLGVTGTQEAELRDESTLEEAIPPVGTSVPQGE